MEKQQTPMMFNSYAPIVQPLPLASNPQVRRHRQQLIILLSVCLALSFITVSGRIVKDEENVSSTTSSNRLTGIFIDYACLIAFYGLGILAAHRYSTLGLRIYAWFNVIGLVVMGLSVAVLVFTSVVGLTLTSQSDDFVNKNVLAYGSLLIFSLAVICAIGSLISICIVILCFKLARLIDENRNVITQQI